ncbi:MAG: HlyD family secretion protein [Methylococcales bacterium]|nr:HlyD family secretion protein [Methylococcales bacterium]
MPVIVSKKSIITILFLLSFISAGIWYWLHVVHPYESTDNAYLKAHTLVISPKEGGYVKEVLFHDNQKVKQGDLLVVIDDHDFQAKVKHAEAQVLLETAHIKTLEMDKRGQTAKVQQESAGIEASKAELDRASKDLKRFINLAKEGAISAQTKDTAESSHKQATAQLNKVTSARLEEESQLATLEAQIEEARARIKIANTTLELARIDLANTRITAPSNGTLGNRSVEVGQLLKPGSPLAYLIPNEGLFVAGNFKETQITEMQVGQTVEIKVDAYPDQEFKGVIDSFSPASGSEFSLLPTENATGNFTKIVRRVPVKIIFLPDNDISQLKPGLSTAIKVKVR